MTAIAAAEPAPAAVIHLCPRVGRVPGHPGFALGFSLERVVPATLVAAVLAAGIAAWSASARRASSDP